MTSPPDVGRLMYGLVERLFPICRSLTGDGVRQTLAIVQEHVPDLTVHEVPSGTQVFDWTIPDEWTIRDAFIADMDGNRIVDFRRHNLHVVGYSEPVDRVMTLDELQPHLHSLPDQPTAIPYVTSYYQRRWGFCLSHDQRRTLGPGPYRVLIDSRLEPGSLTYGEAVLPGSGSDEVFVSTYICHPSMANNELSGPAVAAYLARFVAALPQRRLTYRFVFIPETIGAITYVCRHLEHLRRHVKAAFNVSCVGDERVYSFLPSRRGGTLADRVALHVMEHMVPGFIHYPFLARQSDERQYCAPGVDLPMVSVMRSKYGTYPEYHTSLDDLSLVTPAGLAGTYDILTRCVQVIEAERTYRTTVVCEPQMGKRGLYSTLGGRGRAESVQARMDILTFCDGDHSVLDIAGILTKPVWDLIPFFDELRDHGLIAETPSHL